MENQKRTKTLQKLVSEYYTLLRGHIIEKPTQLLRIVDIKDTKHKEHPHKNFRVYISRKALKHFVESRKEELEKRHTSAETLLMILFAVEKIPEVFLSFDKYEYETNPQKYFYTKHYGHKNPSLRIFVEKKDMNALEICSMHFTKNKKEK